MDADVEDEMLRAIYNALDYGTLVDYTTEIDWQTSGSFYSWNQHEFYPSSIDWENDINFKDRDDGYLYVPKACENTQCRVHFALHGCGGNPAYFARNRYNKLGALNNIIMVYPDTRCWNNHPNGNGIDTKKKYKTRDGILPTAFRHMIERVTGTEGVNEEVDKCVDGEDEEEEEESGTSITDWLDSQQIPAHDERCVAKFRLNANADSTNRRLFHGHDCGDELDYPLISQIYLPVGTWSSSAI